MSTVTVIVTLALLATLGALISGVISMAHGGAYDERHSVRFMEARIGLQAVTVVLLLAAVALASA